LVVAGVLWVFMNSSETGRDAPEEDGVDTITHTDYSPPPVPPGDGLADDRLDEKETEFDPAVVDRRPLGDWEINASEAVIRLDTPMLRPDQDAPLLVLHPSYRAAAEAAKAAESMTVVLPSVNQIDGKAKQFDDGLYAALDLAYYRGLDQTLASHVGLVRRIFDAIGPDHPGSAYLAAGLSLAGVKVAVKDEASKAAWLASFEATPARSKPIGFYTWSPSLTDCFRFLRYFQGPLPAGERPAARAIAAVLKANPAIMADYRKALGFYAKLTNPSNDATLGDLADDPGKVGPERAVVFFPSATSRETELFERIFPTGLPPDADLMRAMIDGIRSGRIDLRPTKQSGWYDYQIYAIETMLLPERGSGGEKLLLTRAYKARMVEAFKALMTKRRETHVRGVKTAAAAEAMMPAEIAPRLRLEPCPSYYLRTARAYEFLRNFLQAAVGEPALKGLHGLKEGGERPADLSAELQAIRDLFYGCYLVSSEDIGDTPHFLDGEVVDRGRCEAAAIAWLAKPLDDPDMAVDTRVSVPIYFDRPANKTRLWATLGVRLARLEASYARPPRLRVKGDKGEWQLVESYRLGTSRYLIAVDEFAEIELPGVRPIDRVELRKVCDSMKTKEEIVKALEGGK
jgi:hypothetical protein